MSSIPHPHEEGKLPAPPSLKLIKGGSEPLKIAEALANLQNPTTPEAAKEIMEELHRNKTISKNENGFYEPNDHDAVKLYRQVLIHFRKQREADSQLKQAHETRKDVKQVVEKSKREAKASEAMRSFAKASSVKELLDTAKPLVGTLLDYDQNKRIVAIEDDHASVGVFKAFIENLERLKQKPTEQKNVPKAKTHQAKEARPQAKQTLVTARPETREQSNEKIATIKRSFSLAKTYGDIFKIANPLVGTLLGHDQNKKMIALPHNAQSAEIFKAFNEALERMRKKPEGDNKPTQPKLEKPTAPKAKQAAPKPAIQNPAKPKAIKDMNENEVADLIIEAATGISPNKETEKRTLAFRQLSETIKANPKLKIIPRALSAFAEKRPEKIFPGLTLDQLETIIRKAVDIIDPELGDDKNEKTPKSLQDLEALDAIPSTLGLIARDLNKLIEEAKASQKKKA